MRGDHLPGQAGSSSAMVGTVAPKLKSMRRKNKFGTDSETLANSVKTERSSLVAAEDGVPYTDLRSQRDGALQREFARNELPWESIVERSTTPTALRPCPFAGNSAPMSHNPVGVDNSSFLLPRVARDSQPWALMRNPVGIEFRKTTRLGFIKPRFRPQDACKLQHTRRHSGQVEMIWAPS